MFELAKLWIQLKEFADEERFQSLVHDLISHRIEINSSEEGDKGVRELAASMASACGLSIRKKLQF
jgi:hypothetical protein